MAYGGIAEDGGLPAPWLEGPGEELSWWGWSGDEETLPFILPNDGIPEGGGPAKDITGPWTVEETKPFLGRLWTPLRPRLPEAQEKLNEVKQTLPVNVNVPINAEPVGLLNPSQPLLNVTDPPVNEPSQFPRPFLPGSACAHTQTYRQKDSLF